MFTVERDNGHTIENAQCIHPVLLGKLTLMQLEREHDDTSPAKVATRFVLNDCSGDSGILANIADKCVLLPKESTGQTFLTPTASTASTSVDTRTGSVSDVCVVDNDDELWLIETDYESGWSTRFKIGAHRGMPYGVVPRDNPKKGRTTDSNRKRARCNNFFFTAQNRHTDLFCSAPE